MCLIEVGVNGAVRSERRTSRIRGGSNQTQTKPCQELSLTSRISDERRIKYCQFLHSLQFMLAPRACPTKAFSEYLVGTILAFVKALEHNVVMLHSDQECVLVQLLKAVQSR